MKIFSLLMGAVLFFSLPVFAVEAVRGPLSSSLGGTGIAGLEGIEGVLLNPAHPDMSTVSVRVIRKWMYDGRLVSHDGR